MGEIAETHWLSRNKGIELKENCVRYENECFAYYVSLGRIKEEMVWHWQPKQLSCPMDVFKDGGNNKPMKCVSFYKPDE